MTPGPRTDWFRIFADLSRHGHNISGVATRIGVPYSTAASWRNNLTTPNYEAGRRLIDLWSSATGKDAKDRPKTIG
jgi:transposase-like protein